MRMRVSSESDVSGMRMARADIQTTFRSDVVAAGALNSCSAFRTPIVIAVMQISGAYGSMILISGKASLYLNVSGMNGSITKSAAMPTRTIAERPSPSNVSIRLANRSESCLDSFSRLSVNAGMKADDNAPSPKSLRKRLGIWNASTKAD